MKQAKRKFFGSIAALLALYGAYACATELKGPKMANHAFEFGSGTVNESPGIEVLAYRYGDSKVPSTYSDPHHPTKTGGIAQSTLVHGPMPVGDYLYVKWQVLATDKVYEDTVDLKSRLPRDMEDKRIYFVIKDTQLQVYLIWDNEGNSPGDPDCPIKLHFHNKCERIYPDHWKNY